MFVSRCSTHLLRKELHDDTAAQIKSLIHDAALAAAANAGKQAGLMQKAFANEVLQAHHEELGLADRDGAATREATPSDGDNLCARDLIQPCPAGWRLVGDKQCEAPQAYQGPCKHLQSFASTSSEEKLAFSTACKAPWPCRDECQYGRDYDQVCPDGWSYLGNGFCQTTQANATCSTLYNFHELSPPQKQDIALACGISWPCKTQCPQDYQQPCPDGWHEIAASSGYCLAPSSYAGECDYAVNTAKMSMAQKSEFARKCAVNFPCSRI